MSTPPPTDDNERTVMPERGSGDSSPVHEHAAAQDHLNELPVGTRLGEFEITGLVGIGGFGIVYLGYDHSLQRTVAIKEYMPSALAERRTDTTVALKSARHADTFKAGLKSFINEARLLAQFDHPALLKVYRFWEANGTAYMVMPYYEGPTLKQALADNAQPPDEKSLKALLAPLLDALEVMHQAQCFHRDIAPDNILLLKGQRPLLLDFGAARRVIGDMNQALTVIVKAGYAPLEQYAENPSMRQGAWTDLYALASVVYFAIMGQAPVPSLARMRVDQLVPLAQAAAGRYSDAFLRALDAALALEPEDRPQTVADFRRLLGLSHGAAHNDAVDTRFGLPIQGAVHAASTGGHSRRGFLAFGVLALIVAIGAGMFAWRPWERPSIRPDQSQVGQTDQKAPQSDEKAPQPELKAQPDEKAPPTEQKAPQAEQTPAKTDPLPLAPAPAPPPPPKPFNPINALAEIYTGRDPSFAVAVTVAQPRVRIDKDRLRFSLTSARAGYVYLLYVGTTQTEFMLLFPNAKDRRNGIAANARIDLPRTSWPVLAGGPPGRDHLVVIVSERPRDFARLALKEAGIFAQFPLDEAEKIYGGYTGTAPLFAGKPICSPMPDSGCPNSYGAAEFSIEEVNE